MGDATSGQQSGQQGAPKQRSRVITERTRARYLQQYAVNTATGCWDWTGTIERSGYGSASNTKAHRLFYEHHVGPIPEGLTLDHLCCNRACVNPAHLEPVTLSENVHRAFARQTHCKYGHTLADAYIGHDGRRRCKTCHARYAREGHRRKTASQKVPS